MILLKDAEKEFIKLNSEYKSEDELRNIFIDSFKHISELLIPDIDKSKSFSCVKEVDCIDVVIIDNNGSIFLVETKLRKNTDARRVVAQILEYCTELRKKSFEYFQNKYLSKIKEKGSLLNDYALNNLERNLREGNFHLLIVMDYLIPKIEDEVKLLREKKFKIYGIELNKYSYNDTVIISPKISLDEYSFYYKKEVPKDSEYIKSYSDTGLGKQIQELVSFFNEIEKGDTIINDVKAIRTPKYIIFKILDNAATASLYINPEKGNAAIDFWCNRKEFVEKLSNILKRFNITIKNIEKDKGYGKIGKWNLEDFSKEKFKKILENISSINQNQSYT